MNDVPLLSHAFRFLQVIGTSFTFVNPVIQSIGIMVGPLQALPPICIAIRFDEWLPALPANVRYDIPWAVLHAPHSA